MTAVEQVRNGVRLQLMGCREGLPVPLLRAFDKTVAQREENESEDATVRSCHDVKSKQGR